MARATRSKKVEISEDNTALAPGVEALPLPHTSSQIQPLAEAAGNKMAEEEVSVEAQMKDLKEAYRIAIGVPKKNKKGKNKKKAGVQQELEIANLSENNGVPAGANRREISEGSLVSRMKRMTLQDDLTPNSEDYVLVNAEISTEPSQTAQSAAKVEVTAQSAQPAARTTRRQAKAQEAEEALRKASRETTNKETTQVREEAISLQAEPRQMKENLKSHQAAHELAPAPELAKVQTEGGDEDSFVDQITSRSPAKPVAGTRDSLELRKTRVSQSLAKLAASSTKSKDGTQAANDEDSFLEQITSRSPAKQVSRIEDSVEALDQMEEVEEALHEAAMAERMVSPEKARQKREQLLKQPAVVGTKTARGSNVPNQQPIKSGYATMRVKPSAPKHASIIKKATSMTFKPSESSDTSSIRDEANKCEPITKKAPIKRPISLLPPKELVKSAKPVTRPTNFELPGETVARKLKEQRERRLAQRESSEDSFYTARQCSGPNIKSTKPLTKPAFELPGEALSRKKREAHEAKLKAQEEEERKRREFKAKPVRKSIITNIRDTVASRARQSKVGVESVVDGNLTVSKRSSINVGAHRPSILELTNMVTNTSAQRVPAPPTALERKPSTKFHGPSMSGLAMQRTVSATEVQVQRQRAKEIYNRDQRLAEDIERERREREAAAKRSREEAAERGRQASREWAEKQRAKKLAEGDKGMSAGYGPGGQIGLKA